MSRMYTVPFAPATVATASGDVDLFELTPADDKPVEIVGICLYVTSELGDAADEWMSFSVIRGHTTSGNGGSVTPAPINPIDAAAGFTAETNGATIASAGTGVTLHSGAINVRAGDAFWWPDGMGPVASQANTTMVVRQTSTFADDVTLTGTLYVREMP